MQSEPKANILLVDDHPENLLALEAVLSSLGQNLVKANSGMEALRCLLNEDFAVILLDVQMPELDGFETARLIRARERSRQTPIIFQTAYGTSDTNIFTGYSLGAIDYLVKPIEPEILLSKVSMFVGLFKNTAQVKQQALDLEAVNAELKKNDQQFRSFSACLPVGIFMTDIEGKCTYTNPRCQAICGFTLEESLGDGWLRSVYPEDSDRVIAQWYTYTHQRKEYSHECRFQTREGIVRWAYIRSSPLLSDKGELIGFVGTVEDITPTKEAEASLRESKQMLQLVMNNIPQLIFWKDRKSVYLGCNYNFARVAGVNAPEGIVGKTDYDLAWNKEEADWYRECDNRIMEADTPQYHIVETQFQADGKQSWAETNKIPLHDDAGNVVGILGTYEDITDKKLVEETLKKSEEELKIRVEERTLELNHTIQNLQSEIAERQRTQQELQQAKEAAEVANCAKSDFLSLVSHELRTPLTSVLGFAKIIKKKLDSVIFPEVQSEDKKVRKTIKQVEENLDIIVSEGERLTNLINSVLDLAKLEAGKIEWKTEPIYISEIIAQATAATSALFETKPLKLIKDIENELPELVGDKDRLVQVVINLISNAVKFTPEGCITCRAKKINNEVIISVIDSGIGIAEADQEQVFEKFKQVGDTLTDKPKGTGLGLPICKQIVEHHQGRIWVESKLGKESKFSFTLPISTGGNFEFEKVDLDTLLKQLKGHVITSKASSNKQKKTILVVDDEASIRELLTQQLEAEGYIVRQAKDGMDAITQVKKEHPDLIILDVMMPAMNGFDVAAVLKNDPETTTIPIIILSIIEDKDRGYCLGIDRYLAKPINQEELLNAIESLLAQETSKKKVLVVDEDESTIKILTDVLQAKGYSVVEASNGQECLEKAISAKPDMIIIDSILSKRDNLAKTLRFEKGLENVLFFLVANGNVNGLNQS
ncbi:response regulator [Coleofasciculus sp. FACHB-542]|uniref:response regulator n=1 Tax=Coleofasciculus sp. FACHB-542 TaxID=2692787 RepID=UPI001686AC09|nr:response regulator [Coleofasciculus sp. FACHB-542]MBD2084726.1 response regulator [Coleofasciculus sp. FACHB-542]